MRSGCWMVLTVVVFAIVGAAIASGISRWAIATGDSVSTALVVFDFGNTTVTYRWVDVGDGLDGLNATLIAAKDLNYEVNYTVGEYGAFVNSINGLANADDYSVFWILLIWNHSTGKWQASDVGISYVTLNPGDYLCWYYGAWGNLSTFNPLNITTEKAQPTEEGESNEKKVEEKGFIPLPWYVPIGALIISVVVIAVLRKRENSYEM